ncbi:MAG TPA: alanine--tRNA ligase [Firmicutes bacterium]|nr:alanine--tRNA ligase [Bacillota bacterium]
MDAVPGRLQPLSGSELRRKFLGFFRDRGHLILPSASLIPHGDPTLLLTGAGMVPFKPYFLGTETPPSTRISTCQRCLRTADIDNVGKTARHCTFFEMLGNFSFGDYFKKEAIPWAWEFVTSHLGFDPEDLWVTIYLDDDEAFEIWNKAVGVPAGRIVRLGKETNFWEIGVGPCGPCSEIYVDRGPEYGCGRPGCGVECDCDRFMEVWNLVFIQFRKDEAGEYHLLDKKSIDTGMGLERASAILQGVRSVFETDLLQPVVAAISRASGKAYGEREEWDRSIRVITDHMRGVTFLVSDGVSPSNEGRGYVLRRLLRRSVRHGRLLGIERPFLSEISWAVIDVMKDAYPELTERSDYILKTINAEESRFVETLEQGTGMLDSILGKLRQQGVKVLSGADAFRLYDTYGFPYELTEEICQEAGVSIDHEEFLRLMNDQRERARAARQVAGYLGDATVDAEKLAGMASHFIGYGYLRAEAGVTAAFTGAGPVGELREGETGQLVLDRTPFYPEAGGQVGDTGIIEGPSGKARVSDTRRLGEAILHEVKVEEGSIAVGDTVTASVDEKRRLAIARNHTATHLLHAALRRVLGHHVFQSGSLVAPDRLRFDFSNPETPGREELARVEDLVNDMVMADLPVEVFETSLEEARKMGAIALFGEKYGERVRVVRIQDKSLELCGGTHLARTGQVGLFKIVGAGSVAAGIKRVEALTGNQAITYVRDLETSLMDAAARLKTTREQLADRIDLLLSRERDLERELSSMKDQALARRVDDVLRRVEEYQGVKILVSEVEGLSPEELRGFSDLIKAKIGSGVLVLGSRVNGRASFLAAVTRDLTTRGLNAGEIVRETARVAGGGGGGRPEIAEAGARDAGRLGAALDAAREIIRARVGRLLQ